MSRKVTVEEIEEALSKTNGNLTNTARLLGIRRETLWHYSKEDERVASAIKESRKVMLDKCLTAAQALALGVPLMENGKFVGWQEKPDAGMLKYFISCLGRDEGFGENVDVTSGGAKIEGIKVEIIDKRDDVEKCETVDTKD